MGLLLLCFPDRYGPLQESVGPNEGLVAEAISGGISKCGWAILDSAHSFAAAWDFAFKGEGFRHCWRAFDSTATVGGPSTTTTAATLAGCDRAQSRARTVQEPAESPPAQAYPNSPIYGGHQFRCPYSCAWPHSGIGGGPSTSSTEFCYGCPSYVAATASPLGPAGSTDVAAMPPKAAADADVVMVKAMQETPTPITVPDVVVKAMPVAPPGTSSSNGTCYRPSPCQLEGGGCFSGHRAYGYGGCCDRGGISNNASGFRFCCARYRKLQLLRQQRMLLL